MDSNIKLEKHKCPSCGYDAREYQAICPYCKHVFEEVKQSNSMLEFTKQLNKLESKRKGKMNYGVFDKFIPHKADTIDDQIIALIKSYDFPNSVLDTYSFMAMASSHIIYDYEIDEDDPKDVEEKKILHAKNDAWKAMMDRALNKAKISYGDQTEYDSIKEIYDVTLSRLNRAIRDANAPVKKFKKQLEKIESERYIEEKPEKHKKRNNKDEPQLTEQQKTELKSQMIENKVLDLIRNFDVPNYPEEVLEFMRFAVSNVNFVLYYNPNAIPNRIERDRVWARNTAWMNKIEQMYQNAKLSYGNERIFVDIKNVYDEALGRINDAKLKRKAQSNKDTMIIVIIAIAAVVIGGIIGLIVLVLQMLGFNVPHYSGYPSQINSESKIIMDSDMGAEYKENTTIFLE